MDHTAQANALLDTLKTTLRIDGDDDENLIQYLLRSMNRLDTLAGVPVDYLLDLEAQELLFNRIRYDYNSSLEYWEENFSQPILSFMMRYGVDSL